MSWPEQEIIDTCPYGSAVEAERAGFSACEVCAIPDYACAKIDEYEYARRHCRDGCTHPEQWLYGCWCCEERYDAYDMVVPCKRKAIGE